ASRRADEPVNRAAAPLLGLVSGITETEGKTATEGSSRPGSLSRERRTLGRCVRRRLWRRKSPNMRNLLRGEDGKRKNRARTKDAQEAASRPRRLVTAIGRPIASALSTYRGRSPCGNRSMEDGEPRDVHCVKLCLDVFQEQDEIEDEEVVPVGHGGRVE